MFYIPLLYVIIGLPEIPCEWGRNDDIGVRGFGDLAVSWCVRLRCQV